jgi:hypothetical protein
MTEDAYTHRNGETETPALTGRYWLWGHMPMGEGWGYDFGPYDDIPLWVDVETRVVVVGDDYGLPLDKFEGRFWGPVQMPVSPWEKN